MRHLLLVLLFSPFLACKSPSVSYDDATKVKGRYIVTAYIVANDTLYSMRPTSTGYAKGINKLGIESFAVAVERTGENQVQISTSYYRNGANPTQSKVATVSQAPNEYTLSLQNDSLAAVYDGKVVRNTLYQKQSKGGLYIPITLSGVPAIEATSQEVIIVAQPQ